MKILITGTVVKASVSTKSGKQYLSISEKYLDGSRGMLSFSTEGLDLNSLPDEKCVFEIEMQGFEYNKALVLTAKSIKVLAVAKEQNQQKS